MFHCPWTFLFPRPSCFVLVVVGGCVPVLRSCVPLSCLGGACFCGPLRPRLCTVRCHLFSVRLVSGTSLSPAWQSYFLISSCSRRMQTGIRDAELWSLRSLSDVGLVVTQIITNSSCFILLCTAISWFGFLCISSSRCFYLNFLPF